MKKTVLFLLVIFTYTTLFAQEVNFEWAKSLGGSSMDEGYSIATDNIGNVYTTGAFEGIADFDPGSEIFNLTSSGLSDIFIQKMDPSGNLLWAKSVGGSQVDVAFGISVDALGNVYITGFFSGTVDFDPGTEIYNLTSSGSYDIFILKLDTNGNFLWAKSIGGESYDSAYGLTLDDSGNVYIIGYFKETVDFDPGTGIFYLNSAGSFDGFVLKLDASGNFEWAKSIGGNMYDYSRSVAVGTYGSVYISGYFEGTVDFDPGSGESILNSSGAGDVFIQKLDTSGNFIWAKSIGGEQYDNNRSISTDIFGNIYVSGDFSGTADFDPGTETVTVTSVGGYDVFILKMNSSGNFVWVKSVGGIADDIAYRTVADEYGNVYTVGDFFETVDFDPDFGEAYLASNGEEDVFIQKLDSLGNFVWAKSMGGKAADIGYGISLDASGNIFTTGIYAFTVDFDPGSGENNLTAAGYWDIFVQKMSQETVGVESVDNLDNNISVYPNPSKGIITIKGENINEIKVINLKGIIVNRKLTSGEIVTIDLSQNPNGIYFVKAETKKGTIIKKIVLE